ncbi:hypothetical protein [Actinomadura madurae]|uniref:hypothetical protein n=1 Tax=Actinomadura madurae TaxID=1993 RepID=UPI0020D1FDFB|nr:hypothetical protein [Actinomadura madurae]MCQ0017933.1 hypothetical protein [Actinomadura madurae]
MAVVLARLGRFCFRRRGLVVLLWAGLLVLSVSGAALLSEPGAGRLLGPRHRGAARERPGRGAVPAGRGGGASARVVFAVPAGRSLVAPATRAAVEQAVARIEAAPKVAEVASPTPGRPSRPTDASPWRRSPTASRPRS